jgi:branched-chain amino acid transport system permease protein
MYYLIAFWVVVCAAVIHALSATPLGRLANAVRDNPLRVEFLGYNPTRIRFLMVVLAGFFAGVAGGLNALRAEIVTAEALSDYTSGIVILMAFTGGIGSFYGPIIGAAVVTVLQVAVASVTPAWPFYFGLFFVLIVLYAPGGIVSLFERRWQPRVLGTAFVPALLLVFGTVGAVEMAYARSGDGDPRLRLVGVPLDGESRLSWVVVAAAVAAGIALLKRTRPQAAPEGR